MFDLKYFKEVAATSKKFFIAGCDEVGRGPLAGPVVAACASLTVKKYDQNEVESILSEWLSFGITDSKKLTSLKRQEILKQFPFNDSSILASQLYTHTYSKNISLNIFITEIQASMIDEINILQASLRAMKEAMIQSCPLETKGLVLIDGNRKFSEDNKKIKLETVIKGDSKSLLIGLASIAAKEYRDLLMKELGSRYPGYGWEQNAGYPTAKHLEAILDLGVTEIHRLTFKGVREVYEERGYRGV